ncbi:MAG TPA: aldehyde dehydrogenase family protein, partial [Candidatus Acidoferrales bacterium]|nr:aldehyde dehydrogenase family protein [Candidatus Acidoferrales bacterium]
MATAVSSTQACRNFIGGKWVESKATKIAERRNPANTDEVVARVPHSTREEMRAAIAAAKAAFPAWRDTPAPNRGKILFKAVRIMEEQKEDLARMLTLEEGKALKDSLGEVQRSINILEFMAGEARRLNGESYPSELPKNFSYTVRTPIGVIGAITPWNFPLAIPVWKVAPALVAGNTCVLKPAELTPLCAIRMTEIFEQAGLPAGVLNLVLGAGEEVGDELVQNRDV